MATVKAWLPVLSAATEASPVGQADISASGSTGPSTAAGHQCIRHSPPDGACCQPPLYIAPNLIISSCLCGTTFSLTAPHFQPQTHEDQRQIGENCNVCFWQCLTVRVLFCERELIKRCLFPHRHMASMLFATFHHSSV